MPPSRQMAIVITYTTAGGILILPPPAAPSRKGRHSVTDRQVEENKAGKGDERLTRSSSESCEFQLNHIFFFK